MIRFPNCKINLGLHILGKRKDGYHNLETVFYPLQIKDALEVITAQPEESTKIILSGLPVSGDSNNNLCYKAWQLLKNDFPQLPDVSMHLHKAIPMGAGLGGGSADGSFALLMLNEKYNLQLSSEMLAAYALQLGSDCPFFIHNKPCFAQGRGEVMQPINLSFAGYYFYVVNPNIHISTSEAFSGLQYKNHTTSLLEIIEFPIEDWKNNLVNDFEAGIAERHPEIADIKQHLYQHDAVYAAMSGSGSTVFGIFKTEPEPMPFPQQYFTAIVPA